MKARLQGPPLPALRATTVIEALRTAAASKLGLTFVDAAERETLLPYAELHQRARKVAAAVAARGIVLGDRVAMVLPTGVGFMDAFFGALLAGAVPVPLYPPLRLGRLDEYHPRTARMIQLSGARMLVTDARVRRLLGQSVAAAAPELGLCTVESLHAESNGELEVEADPQSLAVVQFSSGTTVDAKPVALTHANVLANLAAIDAFLPESSGATQTGVSWLPLYHDMGLIGCLLEALYHPGALCLIPPELFLARPALWLRAISRHKAIISPAPNFAYGLCTKRIRDDELTGVDLSSWKLALNGAEPVSPATLRAFADRFAPWKFAPEALTPVYGLSEASLAVTFSSPEARFSTARVDGAHLARTGIAQRGDREIVSVGRPLPGAAVEIRDRSGEVVEEGVVGRVFVEGPSVMARYLGGEARTEPALDTGDLGFLQDGELYLAGRAKELVILRGANHAPQVFEEALENLPGVRTGCAIAFGFVPPDAEGEELGLLVERDSAELPQAELIESIRARVVERTAIRPHTVSLLAPGTLPRTSSGKLRRGEAARQFQVGELAAPTRVNAFTVARAVVKSELALLMSRLGS
jgi:fatty-acyl-CoA synthase